MSELAVPEPTNRRPLPADLAEYECPAHLAAALAHMTKVALAEVAADPGTYLEATGTLGYFQLPSEAKLRAFYTAANMARRELKLPTWPDFATWARANRITVIGSTA